MARSRRALSSLLRAAAVLLVLGVAACDCGDGEPSDEDLIEKFIADVTGDVDAGYVQRCLAYVDLDAYPLDVRVPQHAGVYDAERGPEIEKAFRRVVDRRFKNTEIKRRSAKFEIEGNRADVHLALLTAVGPLRAELTLEKAAPLTWKVSKVHIEPRF